MDSNSGQSDAVVIDGTFERAFNSPSIFEHTSHTTMILSAFAD